MLCARMEPDLMTLKLIFSLGLAMENGTSLHLNFAKWKNGIEKDLRTAAITFFCDRSYLITTV